MRFNLRSAQDSSSMIARPVAWCLAIVVCLLAGCARLMPKDPLATFKTQSAQEIYRKAETAFARKRYHQAIESYEALNTLYPTHAYAETVQLRLIQSFYQKHDMPSAATEASRFIHLYPKSARIDYVYYLKGLAHFYQDRGWYLRYAPIDLSQRDLSTQKSAYEDFTVLIRRFPNSPYVADARQRIAQLHRLFAQHDLHIADFYYRKKAYIAAENRAAALVKAYPGTPEAERAARLEVASHQALGLT
jgi:outer membrane protein assembly factor BamD